MSAEFDLHRVAEVAGYLAALGVTHLYSSPLLQATSGSAHGYDVVDHSRVDAGRGGEAGRLALVAALRACGMGLVVDIVPNHVGVSVPAENPAVWDLLRRGRDSQSAALFDVDWSPGRLLLPVLESPDGLDELRLERGELRYQRHRFPIASGTGGGTAREVHRRQHYRLVPAWPAAEVGYRTFFGVSALAAVRVEDPEVFAATHAELLRWAREGELDGVRVDYPDALADPVGYLAALRAALPTRTWVVVEKVLQPGEELPRALACEGTTGYDALREVTGVFVDPAAEAAFTELDAELTGRRVVWADLVHDCKREVCAGALRAELCRLARLAAEVEGAEDALTEVLACFPVCRSYLPHGLKHLERALAAAARRRPDLAAAIGALRLRLADPADELAVRFQQLSGPALAKGVEDLAFCRWTRFAALNEVGGDPARFGLAPARFHAACARRQRRWPQAMTTLSTHDSRYGEDLRARLAVLSELPGDWARALRAWNRLAPLPDATFAQHFWQTVVGAWPVERERLHGWCERTITSAPGYGALADPGRAHQQTYAVVERLYHDPRLRGPVGELAARITPPGWSNSLGQKLVQLTMPGVPDVYQGCELWDNALGNPDNRRPVDFAARAELLARLDAGGVPALDAGGAAKLLVVSRALRLRRDRPEAFGSFTPLQAVGSAAAHALAFDRGGAITVVTRLPVGLWAAGGWRETALELPPGEWTDELTRTPYHGRVRLAELLARLPVALLSAAGRGRADRADGRPEQGEPG